jgi:hypothetical protein
VKVYYSRRLPLLPNFSRAVWAVKVFSFVTAS